MKVIADTNVLIRAWTGDDPRQAKIAQAVLEDAELVAVTLLTLCEVVWVLARVYKARSADIGAAIRGLRASANVALDGAAVDAGLAMLDAGGDFADGVMAHSGKWLGGEVFVSFDKTATNLLKQQGKQVHALA